AAPAGAECPDPDKAPLSTHVGPRASACEFLRSDQSGLLIARYSALQSTLCQDEFRPTPTQPFGHCTPRNDLTTRGLAWTIRLTGQSAVRASVPVAFLSHRALETQEIVL